MDSSVGFVRGDANRLQQILWNLLSNALKFTPAGGRIQVILERVNSHVEVVVEDSGVGIAADFLPFVFERFRQADAAMTRRRRPLPAIAVTAYARAEDRQRSLLAGYQMHLAKPIEARELVAGIASLLQLGR